MRLKWKLRLYYGVLLVVLLALLAGATSALVLHQFRRERDRREAEASHLARRLLEDGMASIDSAVARAVRDPELVLMAQRDLAGSRRETLGDWVPLAGKLAQLHGLPVLKILDGEGIVLSSAHWPAAYNVTDSPGLVLALEAGKGARLVRERVADGEFLALEAPRWIPLAAPAPLPGDRRRARRLGVRGRSRRARRHPAAVRDARPAGRRRRRHDLGAGHEALTQPGAARLAADSDLARRGLGRCPAAHRSHRPARAAAPPGADVSRRHPPGRHRGLDARLVDLEPGDAAARAAGGEPRRGRRRRHTADRSTSPARPRSRTSSSASTA
jgi:hypothetical protein